MASAISKSSVAIGLFDFRSQLKQVCQKECLIPPKSTLILTKISINPSIFGVSGINGSCLHLSVLME